MLKRRQFMAVGAAAAGAAGLAWAGKAVLDRPGPAVTTSGTAGDFPRTLAETAPAGGGPVRPDMRFDHVAVRLAEGTQPSARIGFVDEAGETSWQPVHFGDHGRDDVASGPAAVVAVPEGAVGYEVRADGAEPAAVAFNTRDGDGVSSEGPATGTLRASEQSSQAEGSSLRFLTRAGWGADESLRFDDEGNDLWPAEFFPVQTITVHHTAMAVGDDPAAAVRAVYQLHAVEQAWGDIGYHLLIDPEGTVYEGRHSGEDRIPVFDGPPDGTGARAVTAGHVAQMNSGNVGVCLLGDFTDAQPTQAAQDSLVQVLSVLCMYTGVNPTDDVNYVNPGNDMTITVQGVSRHRDWLETECPGNTFAENFDAVRDRVAEIVGQG
ncbi:peptidoglycan recognition family protein [Nocardiopsis sediminis]|uniref:Peptidoglycan recognition family protein n=1 Tax=Nocardiopsis sediminis TaxID=1778267 RepID=A0ABV8FL73_9ACTN